MEFGLVPLLISTTPNFLIFEKTFGSGFQKSNKKPFELNSSTSIFQKEKDSGYRFGSFFGSAWKPLTLMYK